MYVYIYIYLVNDAILIPKGTNAQRPGETGAYTIDSVTVSKLEIYKVGANQYEGSKYLIDYETIY